MRHILILLILLPAAVQAQPLASTYATRDGRAPTVVIGCPSADGSFTAGPCSIGKPGAVTYGAAGSAVILAANVPVTVFAAGSVAAGCDVVNTGSAVLYLDFTTTASAGSATSIPLQPGQAYHCPFPPTGAVSAVASQPQAFVAIRY